MIDEVKHGRKFRDIRLVIFLKIPFFVVSSLVLDRITDLDTKMADMSCQIYQAKARHTREQVAAKMRCLHPEDILTIFFQDDPIGHCPKFMVYVDHEKSYVVLLIRGTWGFKVSTVQYIC